MTILSAPTGGSQPDPGPNRNTFFSHLPSRVDGTPAAEAALRIGAEIVRLRERPLRVLVVAADEQEARERTEAASERLSGLRDVSGSGSSRSCRPAGSCRRPGSTAAA